MAVWVRRRIRRDIHQFIVTMNGFQSHQSERDNKLQLGNHADRAIGFDSDTEVVQRQADTYSLLAQYTHEMFTKLLLNCLL
jgi:hypothetical protein